MKERGRYQIQLMKTRSSNGVGMKVDLEYNIETMRITDPGPEGQEHSGGPVQASSILSKIKTSTSVTPKETVDADTGEITPKVTGEAQSTKLKQMLAGLKAKE